MTKAEARKIHAHFEAAARLTFLVPVAMFFTALCMQWPLGDALAVLGASLAFTGTMAAVSVDTISKRIPNGLSLAVLLSAPIWWAAFFMGSDIPATPADGVMMTLMGKIYHVDISGGVLPFLGQFEYPRRILLDLAMMLIAFFPLYLSFAMGLGFGGGDVKLMTAASLFFGWPLGLDFFFLTFVIGGFFSVGVILGRIFSRMAIRLGVEAPKVRKMSQMREYPFAPVIGVAAIICFAIKYQGLN